MLTKNFRRVFVSLLSATIVLGGNPVYAETESAQVFTAEESDGGQIGGMEHMASFNYAYKLTAVRNWLFEQTK